MLCEFCPNFEINSYVSCKHTSHQSTVPAHLTLVVTRPLQLPATGLCTAWPWPRGLHLWAWPASPRKPSVTPSEVWWGCPSSVPVAPALPCGLLPLCGVQLCSLSEREQELSSYSWVDSSLTLLHCCGTQGTGMFSLEFQSTRTIHSSSSHLSLVPGKWDPTSSCMLPPSFHCLSLPAEGIAGHSEPLKLVSFAKEYHSSLSWEPRAGCQTADCILAGSSPFPATEGRGHVLTTCN